METMTSPHIGWEYDYTSMYNDLDRMDNAVYQIPRQSQCSLDDDEFLVPIEWEDL